MQNVQLPDQSRYPAVPSYRWRYLACREAAFSPCGRWLAVVLEGRQRCTDKQANPPLSKSIALYKVAICSASEGYQQQASFCIGSAEPCIHWSAAEPYRLGIAQVQRSCRQPYPPSVQAAAFSVDARTGAVLSCMCPSAAALAQQVGYGYRMTIKWASNCESLLMIALWATRRATGPTLVGWLYVAYAHEEFCCGCAVYVEPDGEGMFPVPAASWHPSSHGILLDWNLEMVPIWDIREVGNLSCGDVSAAGIAIGRLPQPLYCGSAHFSADGQHLVAGDRHAHRGPHAPIKKGGIHVLSCSMRQQQLCFAIVHDLGDYPSGTSTAWLPSQSALLLHKPAGAASPDLVLHISSGQTQALATRLWPGSQYISHSGRLLMYEQARGLHIMDLLTGQVQWTSDTGPNRSLLRGLMPRAQRNQRWDKDISETPFCQGWLPSGLGFVCVTAGIGVAKAPTLCVVTFA